MRHSLVAAHKPSCSVATRHGSFGVPQALRIALCLMLLSFAAPRLVIAEQLTISGLSFAVDELVNINDSQVKVSLFGNSQIIARENIDEYVVDEYFSRAERVAGFNARAIQDFILDSLKHKRQMRILRVFPTWCRLSNGDVSIEESLVSRLEVQAGASSLAKLLIAEQVAQECSQSVRASLLLLAGVGDSAWTRTKGVREAIEVEAALRVMVRARTKESGVSRNFVHMGLVIDFLGAAFGIDDAEYNELRRLQIKVTEAVDDIKRGNLERIYALSELVRGDEWLSTVVSPLLVEALHQATEIKIKKSDSEGALEVLTRIDLKRRTPTTHQLILRALDNLEPKLGSLIYEPNIAHMLKSVALADSTVGQSYARLLERQTFLGIQLDSGEEVRQAFDQLLLIRPDPNPINDSLRVSIVEYLVQKGFLSQAKIQLADIQTGVSLWARLRFMFAGLYFDARYIYILILSPILAGFVLFCLEASRRYRAEIKLKVAQAKSQARKIEEEEPQRPKFVSSNFMRSASPTLVEYREHLAVFGLAEGVDIKSIKTAYRQSVKEVHPDHLGTSQDPKASEKFIHLTKTYERILELRQIIGVDEV